MNLIAALINLIGVILAYLLKALTFSGMISAFFTGYIIYYFLGFGGWVLLLLFFVTSFILGKIASFYSPYKVDFIQQKGSRRDWAQVMANGLLATFCALLYGLGEGKFALVLFGCSIAAATSDTWASEAGLLSKKKPISIKTLKPVEPGMSGGLTSLGTLASLIGSLVIALFWYANFANFTDFNDLYLAFVIAFSGFISSFVDSYLGSTIQGHYHDRVNNKITEKEIVDGEHLELCSGIRWIDNDIVNFISNVVALLIGSILSLIVM